MPDLGAGLVFCPRPSWASAFCLALPAFDLDAVFWGYGGHAPHADLYGLAPRYPCAALFFARQGRFRALKTFKFRSRPVLYLM